MNIINNNFDITFNSDIRKILLSITMLFSFFSLFFIFNLIFFKKKNINYLSEDINILIYLLKLIYKLISQIPYFRTILFSSKSQSLMKFMAFILSKCGQNHYAMKLLKQCDQNNSIETYSSSINSMLSSYYNVSDKAKENYKMFKK